MTSVDISIATVMKNNANSELKLLSETVYKITDP